jgi:hypothetical protein
VACVPELGLASPVGTLRVAEHPMASVRVLTYPFEGSSMLALGGGRLVIYNGCLAVAERSPRPIYVLWPDGYSMVYRLQERPVLIDPVGREVARLCDEVTLGGGYVPTGHADEAIIGGPTGSVSNARRRLLPHGRPRRRLIARTPTRSG